MLEYYYLLSNNSLQVGDWFRLNYGELYKVSAQDVINIKLGIKYYNRSRLFSSSVILKIEYIDNGKAYYDPNKCIKIKKHGKNVL